jgi:hypothetical protein
MPPKGASGRGVPTTPAVKSVGPKTPALYRQIDHTKDIDARPRPCGIRLSGANGYVFTSYDGLLRVEGKDYLDFKRFLERAPNGFITLQAMDDDPLRKQKKAISISHQEFRKLLSGVYNAHFDNHFTVLPGPTHFSVGYQQSRHGRSVDPLTA